MVPLSTSELIELVTLMQEMRAAAAVANWQELTRLDSERRTLLNYDPAYMSPLGTSQIEKKPAPVSPSADSQDESSTHSTKRLRLINQIHSIDQQIIVEIQNAREHLLAENRELSARQKAQKLYAQTSLMS